MRTPDNFLRQERLTTNEEKIYNDLIQEPLIKKVKKLEKKLEDAKKAGNLPAVQKIEKIIKYKDFAEFLIDGTYPQKIIDEDLKEVEKIKNNFDNVATRRSEILEALLLEEIENEGWLGDDDVFAWKTIKYDDYKNHTDIVVELIDDNGEILKLGIDATVGDSEEKFFKKIEIIKKDLSKKYGTKIKYFQSSCEKKEGAINGFPRVIIACTKENLKKLCNLKVESTNKETSLRTTSFQLKVIEEIINQLKEELKFLKNKVVLPGKNKINNLPLYQEIEKLLKHLQKIYKNKKGLISEKDDQTLKVFKLSQMI